MTAFARSLARHASDIAFTASLGVLALSLVVTLTGSVDRSITSHVGLDQPSCEACSRGFSESPVEVARDTDASRNQWGGLHEARVLSGRLAGPLRGAAAAFSLKSLQKWSVPSAVPHG